MTVEFINENKTVTVPEGTTLLEAAVKAGIRVDAPCGGNGTCGKCRALVGGREVLLCRTEVHSDVTVRTFTGAGERILLAGKREEVKPDGKDRYVLAFDIGTTTVVGYLLSGTDGRLLSSKGTLNPQISYGADVISRIQYVLEHENDELSLVIKKALFSLTEDLCREAGIRTDEVTRASIVGNTCMHHLLLGINPRSMTVPPYMPEVFEAMEIPAQGILPISADAKIRVLPNIAGFVGADTVSCILSSGMNREEELCLLIDIGTNGEMVLGNKTRRIACSTAAGPAFEGARISCGMRGTAGAIRKARIRDGQITVWVIGDGEAEGICGSGLIDLTACLLSLGVMDENGYLAEKEYRIPGTEVTLTQRDIREIQVAKAAIAAGVELLMAEYGVGCDEIGKVVLAGAFGTFLDPDSACAIGLLPKELRGKIQAVGNAAGEGAKMCALSEAAFLESKRAAEETEFLELASLPDFQDVFIDALEFPS